MAHNTSNAESLLAFAVVPTIELYKKLNLLSHTLDWGDLHQGVVIQHDPTSDWFGAANYHWTSESFGGAELTIFTYGHGGPFSRSNLLARTKTWLAFDVWVVHWRRRLKAGPIRFEVPASDEELVQVAKAMIPLAGRANYLTPAARRDLIDRYPDIHKEDWSPPTKHIWRVKEGVLSTRRYKY